MWRSIGPLSCCCSLSVARCPSLTGIGHALFLLTMSIDENRRKDIVARLLTCHSLACGGHLLFYPESCLQRMSFSLTEPIDEPMDRSGHLTPADQKEPKTRTGQGPELEPDQLEPDTTTRGTTTTSARTSVPRRINLDPGNFNSTNLCLFDD